MAVPDEPDLDAVTLCLLNAYRNTTRARRYLVGANEIRPLRLSVREISDWLDAHPLPLPRRIIDETIFALDEVAMAEDEDG